MQLIDTHTHLFVEQFSNDINEVLQRARDNGVSHFFLPHIDSDTSQSLLDVCNNNNDCFAMVGLHPCSVKANFKDELKHCEQLIANNKVYGIGETGLDYYWDTTFKKEQKESLQIQIDWAKQLKLPIILHCRDSMNDVIELMEANNDEHLNGIFHCFTGTIEQAQRIIAMGCYLGIGGVATFKNGGMDKVLTQVNLKHLVLETDSPYLAPTPFRGKRNESAYLTNIAQKVADIMQVDYQVVADITTENALKIFKI